MNEHIENLNSKGAKWFKATGPDGSVQYFVAFNSCDVKNWLNAGSDTLIEKVSQNEALEAGGAVDLCPL